MAANEPTVTTDATVEPPATPVAGDQPSRAGNRSGTRALGVEYGSPYDEDRPPWSQDDDPARGSLEARQKAEDEANRQQAESSDDAYVFTGHKDAPYNNTEVVEIGGRRLERDGAAVKLTSEQVSELRGQGYSLRKATQKESDELHEKLAAFRPKKGAAKGGDK